MSSDTLYLLRRLLSNQHTLTGPEFRAELEKIVGEAYQQETQEPVFCSYCGGNDETPQEHCTDCLRPVPAKARIREIFLANGFTIKEGQADLKQYVYDAAYALLSEAPQPAPAPLSEREAFESAWEKLHGKRPVLWSQMFASHKMETPAHSEGKYFAASEQAAWKLWQARAALAAQGGSK